jgi:hypothetical protein
MTFDLTGQSRASPLPREVPLAHKSMCHSVPRVTCKSRRSGRCLLQPTHVRSNCERGQAGKRRADVGAVDLLRASLRCVALPSALALAGCGGKITAGNSGGTGASNGGTGASNGGTGASAGVSYAGSGSSLVGYPYATAGYPDTGYPPTSTASGYSYAGYPYPYAAGSSTASYPYAGSGYSYVGPYNSGYPYNNYPYAGYPYNSGYPYNNYPYAGYPYNSGYPCNGYPLYGCGREAGTLPVNDYDGGSTWDAE